MKTASRSGALASPKALCFKMLQDASTFKAVGGRHWRAVCCIGYRHHRAVRQYHSPCKSSILG